MTDSIKPQFHYGDRIRRKSDRREFVVKDIGQDGYHFEGGGYALIADQDCYVLAQKASGFWLVARTLDGAPLGDHTAHGYETRREFRDALRRLLDYWGGRAGEEISHRNGFLQLRFHDTPGGRPDEAWLPLFLLAPTEKPAWLTPPPPPDPIEQLLDEVFGFDD